MRPALAFGVLVCLLLACGEVVADAGEDTVVLTNGSVWTGRILREDDESITIESVSASGGVARLTFQRTDIKSVRRGHPKDESAPDGGPRLIRDEWFLLRSSGRMIGTRNLQLWSARSQGKPGYRLEEDIDYFAQGPRLPATHTHRVEGVDLRFFPRRLAWRESGEPSALPGGPPATSRSVSGRVVDGVWRGAAFREGTAHRCELRVPEGTRGRLGMREWLLRIPRRVQLLDAHVIEPEFERIVEVRAGFASVTEDPTGKRPGQEFHWEEDGHRFISWFDDKQGTIEEQIAEGIVAVPVSKEQAEAAATDAARGGEGEAPKATRLAEAGISFSAPGPLWSWKASAASPRDSGWRVLGRMANDVLLADVRVELHPYVPGADRSPDAVQDWLLRRLRTQSSDLHVVDARTPLKGLDAAWRLGLSGTLKGETIRTIVAVVDRPSGRVVLLLACPAGAWEQVRPAFDRFLDSLRAL